MNIESPNINQTKSTRNSSTNQSVKNPSVKFSDELKELNKTNKEDSTKETKEVEDEKAVEKDQAAKETSKTEESKKEENAEKAEEAENDSSKEDSIKKTNEQEDSEIKDKEEQNEDLDNAFNGLNSIVQELNKKVDQTEDKNFDPLKDNRIPADNQNKENNILINNDFNIQDNKEILPQMNPNMNFSGDGQPFSSFMNNSAQNTNNTLAASEKDLAEEAAILSTMAENIALANRNKMLQTTDIKQNENTAETKTVTDEQGIRKVDRQTNITVENVVKFDSVIMNQADVEVFANLVENGQADMTKLAPQAAQKSVQVSKTLADLLAKSMENNQPVRIDFDNNISVIIRVSRDGKISADFLPSSQVAEAYLKENLPLLRQRFDDNNIEYDELNQRNSREQDKQNRKKERENE